VVEAIAAATIWDELKQEQALLPMPASSSSEVNMSSLVPFLYPVSLPGIYIS